MVYQEKSVKVKDQLEIKLRSPTAKDAKAMLHLLEETASETPFTGRNPGEMKMTVEEEEHFLEAMDQSPHMLLLIAECDEKIIATSHLRFFTAEKTSHRAQVALAVSQVYWSLGIGTLLMEELLTLAKDRGTKLVELEYIDGNERARNLYDKLGFIEVGRKPKAFKMEEDFFDEVLMVKEL